MFSALGVKVFVRVLGFRVQQVTHWESLRLKGQGSGCTV